MVEANALQGAGHYAVGPKRVVAHNGSPTAQLRALRDAGGLAEVGPNDLKQTAFGEDVFIKERDLVYLEDFVGSPLRRAVKGRVREVRGGQ